MTAPQRLSVQLGPPLDGRCELTVSGRSGRASLVFHDGIRDPIEDLIVAAFDAASGRPSRVYAHEGGGRQALHLLPQASHDLLIEVWQESPGGHLLFRDLSAHDCATRAFWDALRRFEESVRTAPPSGQWAHWFPTSHMAVLTAHVTGISLAPLGAASAREHALLTYSIPPESGLDPAAVRILSERCRFSELVPGREVSWRVAEVARLGATATHTRLSDLARRHWDVSVPEEAKAEGMSANVSTQRVASTEELRPLLDRGLAIQVRGGPYRTQAEAQGHSDFMWDWPGDGDT